MDASQPSLGAPIEPGADPVERLLAELNPPQREAVDPRRGAAARARRRRLGQDPGAHPPDRLAARDRPGAAERDPRDHLHQQGGGGDARAGRRAGRRRLPGDVGDDLPLRLRAHPARRRRAARLQAGVHDLRRGRLAADGQALHRGARDRPEALRAARGQVGDLGGQEPAHRRHRLRRRVGLRVRGDGRRGLSALRAPHGRGQRDGLRRPAGPHGQPARAVRRRPREVPADLPLGARRRVPGHQPRPVPAAAAAGRGAPQPDRGR